MGRECFPAITIAKRYTQVVREFSFKLAKDWPWLIVTSLLVIFGIIVNIDEVWLKTNDDLWISMIGYSFFQTLAIEQGRLAHLVNGGLAQLPYLSDNFVYFKVVQLVPIILVIVVLSTFMGMLFKSRYVGYFQAGVLSVLWQNSNGHNLLTSYPLYNISSFLFLLLSCIFLVQHIRTEKRGFLIASVLLWFATLRFSEFWHLYLLLPLSVALFELIEAKVSPLKKAYFNVTRWYVLVSLVNVIGYVVFRKFNPSTYSGNVINWNLHDILSACYIYSIGLFPGRLYFNGVPGAFEQLSISCLIVIITILVLLYFARAKLEIVRAKLKLLVVFIFALIYVVIPNILISLTAKYQTWALELDVNDYLYSAYSFFAISVCFVVIAIYLSKWKSLYAAFSFVVALLAVLVQINNVAVERSQARYAEKFLLMNAFLNSSLIRDELEISAKTLWGPNIISPDFWNIYAQSKTDKKIRILNQAPKESELVFVEANKEKRSYLLFIKGEQLKAVFYFNHYLNAYCKNDSCSLITLEDKMNLGSVNIKGVKEQFFPVIGLNRSVSVLEINNISP